MGKKGRNMTSIAKTAEKLQAFGFKYEAEIVDGETVAIYWPTKNEADFVVRQNGNKLFWYLGRKAKAEFDALPIMKVDDLPNLGK